MISTPVPRSSASRGVALVVVLAGLVLMSALVIAFFLSVTSERKSAAQYARGVNVKVLADTPVNLVIAQIQKATAGVQAWASQPGAIRTFDAAGAASTTYKLYSAPQMVEATAANLASDVPPTAWDANPAIYADLNEPALVRNQLHFPIVDPRAMSTNPAESVEGFSYDASAVNLAVAPGGPPDDQRLPMPAQWLYLLQDGAVAPATASGTLGAVNVAGATAGNPIVGRIAFWTDDESCKINLNTASEAIPWDVPRAWTDMDKTFAQQPPVRNEVQRYPGHPATTCLSSVLFPGKRAEADGSGSLTSQDLKAIYDLAPRVNYKDTSGSDTGFLGSQKTRIDYDKDRLYATFDELLFSTKANADGTRAINQSATNQTAFQTQLERGGFFLTAQSKAPETTLFGTPRVAIWPINIGITNANSTAVTPFDRTIGFTTGFRGALPQSYFLTRWLGTSSGVDFSPNEQTLLTYVRTLLNKPFPGYGGSWTTKYGASNRDWLTYATYSYVRSANLQDTTIINKPSAGNRVAAWGNREGKNWIYHFQESNNISITAKSPYKGWGREYTVSEWALLFICKGERSAAGGTGDTTDPANAASQIPVGSKKIQMLLVPELFSPAQGYGMLRAHMGISLEKVGTTGYKVSGSLPGGTTIESLPQIRWKGLLKSDNNNSSGEPVWGGASGLTATYTGNGSQPYELSVDFVVPSTSRLQTTGDLKFAIFLTARNSLVGGSNFETEQLWDLVFPPFDANLPTYTGTATDTWSERLSGLSLGGTLIKTGDVVRSLVVSNGDYRLAALRTMPSNQRPTSLPDLFKPISGYDTADIVHSIVGSGGISSLTAPTGFSVRSKAQPGIALPSTRSLVQGVTYSPSTIPDFPILPSDANYAPYLPASYTSRFQIDPSLSRDWDNGVGIAPDGAYINKPDDGARISSGGLPAYMNTAVDYADSDLGSDESFAPNRMINSAVAFGSQPTLPHTAVPWTTLLFRPDITAGGHIGSKGRALTQSDESSAIPPDHAYLDLWWLPVVQPYAISEPYATAGKINMNYQILPYTYINRATGLYGVLKSERLLALSNADGTTYKDASTSPLTNRRLAIDSKGTALQFSERFSTFDFFKSAGEICEQFLVPEGATTASTAAGVRTAMQSYWASHALTGDNSLEKPYGDVYPRLTTRSNVFTVHSRVQMLKKVGATAGVFVDPGSSASGTKDVVLSEFRGSTTIERYIDANDPSLPNYATDLSKIDTDPLDKHYRFRVLSTKQFAQ